MPLSLATANGEPFLAQAAAQSACAALVAFSVPCLVLHITSTSTPDTVLVSADNPVPATSVAAANPNIHLRISLSLLIAAASAPRPADARQGWPPAAGS